jgi:hypothetical protein
VSDPRYVPRSFALDASDFGRKAEIEWVDPEGLLPAELDRLRASQLQHRYSFAISAAIRAGYPSTVAYARRAGIPAATLQRMLRGESVMRIEDIAVARRTLGLFTDVLGL